MSSHTLERSSRTLDLHDLLRIAVVDDVAISPLGALVAVTVRVSDRATNRYRTHVELLAVDGQVGRRLSSDEHNAHAARWSPDGTCVAFLSDRSGSEQVWLSALDGEARQVTHFPLGVTGEPVWSPDSRSLVIVVPEQVGEAGPPASLDRNVSPFTITRSTYRVDGQGYLASRYKHLWVVDARTGNGYPLTQDPADDSAPAWSPDGEYIAFVSNRLDARLTEFRFAIWKTGAVLLSKRNSSTRRLNGAAGPWTWCAFPARATPCSRSGALSHVSSAAGNSCAGLQRTWAAPTSITSYWSPFRVASSSGTVNRVKPRGWALPGARDGIRRAAPTQGLRTGSAPGS